MLICQMVVNGDGNGVIAKALGLAEETVKVHLKTSYKILGIERRTQLLRFFSPQRIDPPVTLINEVEADDRPILDAIADGLTDQQVAERCKVPLATVKSVLRRFKKRTDTSNRTSLAAWWLYANGRITIKPDAETSHDGFWTKQRLHELNRLAATVSPYEIRQRFGHITPKMLSHGMERLAETRMVGQTAA